jgi:hypothetical protein
MEPDPMVTDPNPNAPDYAPIPAEFYDVPNNPAYAPMPYDSAGSDGYVGDW